MKAKVLNPGCFGETMELEGTPEELAAFFKARQTAPQAPVSVPWFYVLDGCPQGGAHEYPSSWLSVSPPQCAKCGQASAAAPQWTVTLTDQVDPNFPCRTEIVPHTVAGLSFRT